MTKRYHPLIMLHELFQLIKNYIMIIIVVFGLNFNSESTFIFYGKILLSIIIVMSIIYIILKWNSNKYELDETAFQLHKGVFTKTKVTVPFNKIQNINYHTSLFHRMFRVTSLSLETAMTDENGTVTFKVLSNQEADRIKNIVANAGKVEELLEGTVQNTIEEITRISHFKPSKKELYRASFMSFSFLLLIPVLLSIFFSINEVYNLTNEAEGIFTYIINADWLLILLLVILVAASIAFGIVKTFWKYGKYEISSDPDRIYIRTGLVEETGFSILKKRVQAIEIKQSLLQKILRLAEVKLICISKTDEENDIEINVLYPFLPYEKAFELLAEILPSFEITELMEKLPKKSLAVKLLEPSWFWIVVTIALGYFKPIFLGEHTWWVLSGLLFLFIYVLRIANYYTTRYTVNNQFIQFKTGSIFTTLFVTKREKIIELKVNRTLFQQMFGLASVVTMNRAKPIYCSGIDDIPVTVSHLILNWYVERKNEIVIDERSNRF